MFEECFSMIELNGLVEQTEAAQQELPVEPAFEDLQSFLVSTLDEALNRLDEEFSTVH